MSYSYRISDDPVPFLNPNGMPMLRWNVLWTNDATGEMMTESVIKDHVRQVDKFCEQKALGMVRMDEHIADAKAALRAIQPDDQKRAAGVAIADVAEAVREREERRRPEPEPARDDPPADEARR